MVSKKEQAMFTLTNYNIRRRYLEEKVRAKARNEEP